MPMCEELLTVGALQGLGKTLSCSVITIVLTAARLPLAVFLTGTGLGLDGIWWAVTVAEVFALFISTAFLIGKRKEYHYL